MNLPRISLAGALRATAVDYAGSEHEADHITSYLFRAADALDVAQAQTDLVDRLCDAVEREAEDIGGESSVSVLQLLGPQLALVKTALSIPPKKELKK